MMEEKPIRVLLADDLPEIRAGWRRMIETTDDVEVIGEAKEALETQRKALQLSPDVVLMDLDWYGDPSAGWVAIRELKRIAPEIRIIALTVYRELIPEARKNGADIARAKGISGDDLLDLIREVVAIDPIPPPPPQHTPLDELTERELQVLTLVIQGATNQEIAEALTITINTANNHVSSILSKLEAKNRTEAAALARKFGLAGPGVFPP